MKIGLIAVCETCVSWHHGGPIEGSPDVPRALQHYQIEGFKGGTFLRPIIGLESLGQPSEIFQSGSSIRNVLLSLLQHIQDINSNVTCFIWFLFDE